MGEPYIKVDVAGQARIVRLASVNEIIPMLALQELDGRAGGFRGLANLRGHTISVFDAQGGALALRPSQFILVTHLENGSTGLIVDEVYDVLRIRPEQMTTSPVGGGQNRPVAIVEGAILPVLEPGDVVNAAL